MEIVSFIISLLFSILVLYAIYWLFENYGFKTVLISTIVYKFIMGIIKNGMSNFFLVLIAAIIGGIIEAHIDRYAYERTNSFGGFLVVGLIVSIIVSFIMYTIVYAITAYISNIILNDIGRSLLSL